MCQLLGMNCNVPTDICFSFKGFQARGGLTGEHTDGWGIAFFEDKGCRVFLDTKPSASSPIAELVRSYPIRSLNVVSHIRKATYGAVRLENTHPFQRELWGRYWVFAHNGDLHGFSPRLDGPYRPVGDTDSERAFCLMLNRLRALSAHEQPEAAVLLRTLREISDEIAAHGTFNYLLSNGEFLLARCATTLFYIVRQSPFSTARLIDEDFSIDFSKVTTPEDRVAVIATAPLTSNEAWTPMRPGELIMFRRGVPVADASSQHAMRA